MEKIDISDRMWTISIQLDDPVGLQITDEFFQLILKQLEALCSIVALSTLSLKRKGPPADQLWTLSYQTLDGRAYTVETFFVPGVPDTARVVTTDFWTRAEVMANLPLLVSMSALVRRFGATSVSVTWK